MSTILGNSPACSSIRSTFACVFQSHGCNEFRKSYAARLYGDKRTVENGKWWLLRFLHLRQTGRNRQHQIILSHLIFIEENKSKEQIKGNVWFVDIDLRFSVAWRILQFSLNHFWGNRNDDLSQLRNNLNRESGIAQSGCQLPSFIILQSYWGGYNLGPARSDNVDHWWLMWGKSPKLPKRSCDGKHHFTPSLRLIRSVRLDSPT